MGDPSRQVSAKIGVALAVLPRRTLADAIGQDGLEALVLGSSKIGMDVQNNPRDLLPHALAHEVRLARIHLEPFLQRDPADVDMKTAGIALQLLAAGENQIVGIARVAA